MRSNNTFIFLIVAVVSFLVYWFFIRKKPDDISNQPSPGEEESSLPVAEMQEIEQVINPDKSVKKDEYAEPYIEPYTEYAEGDGYDFADLSNNITATLKWKNRGGFQRVTQITLIHKVGTTEVNKDVIKKFDTDGTTEIEDNKKYFINRSGLISYTFDNKKTADGSSANLVGTNTFEVKYKLDNGTTGTLLPGTGQDAIQLVISKDLLRLSLELFEPSSQTYKPKMKSTFESGMGKEGELAGTEVYFQWDWKSDADKCYRRIGHMFSMDQIRILKGSDPGDNEKQGYKFQVILDDNRWNEAGAHVERGPGTLDGAGKNTDNDIILDKNTLGRAKGEKTLYYIKKPSKTNITTPEMVWLTNDVSKAQEFKFVDPPSTIKSKLKKKNYFNGGTDDGESTTSKPTRFMFKEGGKDFYMGYSKGRAQNDRESFYLEYFTLDMVGKDYMLDCAMNTDPAERYKGDGCTSELKTNAPKWGPVRAFGHGCPPGQTCNYSYMKANEMWKSKWTDATGKLGDTQQSIGLRNRIKHMDTLGGDAKPYVRKIKGQTNW